MDSTLFRTTRGSRVTPADTINDAGGIACAFSDEHALAQMAVTGCLGSSYYVEAQDQLARILELARRVDAEMVAKIAVFAREKGHMKDVPALLAAVLASRDLKLLAKVYPRVIQTGKMVRNFVQIVRSGRTGRRSLPQLARRAIRSWILGLTGRQRLDATVGGGVRFIDLVKMVHPKPRDAEQSAYLAWAIGKEHDPAQLPAEIQAYEAWKRDPSALPAPEADFRLLTSVTLSPETWKRVALSSSWQTLRQGLSMFARHGVFEDRAVLERVASRLRDPAEIGRARVFPYQLLAASLNAGPELPPEIQVALEDAMEIATANVPSYDGTVVVCPDVSGSMSNPVTGWRSGASSKVRCVDVAALVAACVLRKNPRARVVPFEGTVVERMRDGRPLRLSARDTVVTTAATLAGIGGGATNCAAPLVHLRKMGVVPDLVIYVSDNESWFEGRGAQVRWPGTDGTSMACEWSAIRQKNRNAKLVCIDLTPNATTQVADSRGDVLNVGGFSDQVFEIVRDFVSGGLDARHLVETIRQVEL